MSRNLKILNITKFYHPYRGGMETVVKNITKMNIRKGITSDVLCSNDRFESMNENIDKAQIFRAARAFTLKGTSLCPSMPFKLRQIAHQYDLLHVHFPDPMSALSLFLTKPSTPFIIHWHSDIIKQRKFMPLFMPLQNWCLQEAKKILVTSQAYADHSEYLKSYLDKVVVVPIGIHAESKFKSRIPGTTKRILSVGRLTEYKGFNVLIDAMKFLKDDYRLTIVGSGELYESIQQQIKALNLEARINLLTNVTTDELHKLYETHDLFCLASNQKSEAFGVVLLEAMSHSLPIVACNISGSGVPWVNKDGVSGINTPVNDPEKLANGIEAAMEEKNYQLFTRQAYDRFESHFKVETMMKKIWDVYSELLPKI